MPFLYFTFYRNRKNKNKNHVFDVACASVVKINEFLRAQRNL